MSAATETSNNPVTVLVTFRIKEGKEEEFKKHLFEVIEHVDQEPTCLHPIYVHQDPEDPTRFMLYENWADKEEFLNVQMNRPYRASYMEATQPLWDENEPRKITLWERIDSNPLPTGVEKGNLAGTGWTGA